MLSNRDLQTEAFQQIAERDDVTIVRADAPTANQVAVVWVDEEGLAPNFNISGKYIFYVLKFHVFYVLIYGYMEKKEENSEKFYLECRN